MLRAAITTLKPSGRRLELEELLLELEELLLELEELLPELRKLLLELDGLLGLELLLERGEPLLELPALGELALELLEPGGLLGELDELRELNPLELLLSDGTDRLLELDDGYCGGFSCPPHGGAHGGAQGGAQQLGGYGG